MAEFVLWGTKKGNEPWQEDVIAVRNSEKDLYHAKKWAVKNDFNNIRVQVLDLDKKPDFSEPVII